MTMIPVIFSMTWMETGRHIRIGLRSCVAGAKVRDPQKMGGSAVVFCDGKWMKKWPIFTENTGVFSGYYIMIIMGYHRLWDM